MTVGSLIVLGIVTLAIAGAILSLVKNHRDGHCSCGCDGCSSCKKCRECIKIDD